MKNEFESVGYNKVSGGYALELASGPGLTPLGNPIVLPTARLAGAVAAEWRAQGEKPRKETMPLTQLACIAIDLAHDRREAMCEEMLDYGDTDLVCYRVGNIPELLRIQKAGLNPMLAWVRERFGIRLAVTEDIMPIGQPEENRAKFAALLARYDAWKLAALAAGLNPLGSLVLVLALIERRITAAEAFTLAHIEEEYETRKWGADAEKEARMHKMREEITAVGVYLSLIE